MGYVYFVKPKFRDGPIKIGSAMDINRRIQDLQIANFEELEVIGAVEDAAYKSLETKLHRRFAKWRVRGEWFAANIDMVEQIMGLPGIFTPLGDRILTEAGIRWSLRDMSALPSRRTVERVVFKSRGF